MRLRELREAKGWSQTDFAKRMDVEPCAVGHWESGRRTPSWENAMRIADTLNVSLDDLAGRTIRQDIDATWRAKIAALLE